jgi:hypothetical protein
VSPSQGLVVAIILFHPYYLADEPHASLSIVGARVDSLSRE